MILNLVDVDNTRLLRISFKGQAFAASLTFSSSSPQTEPPPMITVVLIGDSEASSDPKGDAVGDVNGQSTVITCVGRRVRERDEVENDGNES